MTVAPSRVVFEVHGGETPTMFDRLSEARKHAAAHGGTIRTSRKVESA